MHMQAIIYIAQFKCNNQVFMSFLPLLVCFKILIPLFSPMLPYSPNLYLSLVNHPPFYLCFQLLPFVINFHKRYASHWCKAYIGVDGWCLNLAFFMDISKYWNDTTCMALEISHMGSLTLIRIGGAPPPYVIAWVIHLINLSSYRWGNFLHLMTTILNDWYHV